MRRWASILAVALATAAAPRATTAAPPGTDAGARGPTPAATAELDEARALRRLRALREDPGGTGHLIGSIGLGRGLRFNNPYRLATQLGDDAASASLTATYLDVGLAGTYGPADGVQHGAALHLGGALHGVAQPFVTPTYLATWRADPRWLILGRAGPSFLLGPDPNVGGEIAAGAVVFGTAGLGVSAEALFDLFYGAATLDTTAALHPIVSLQLALVVDLEVLP